MNPQPITELLEALTPEELKRVAYAIEEKLVAKPKNPLPSVYDMMGGVGVMLRMEDEAKWEAKKRLELANPPQTPAKSGPR